MARFLAFLGLLLALSAGQVAHAYPLGARGPILSPSPCANKVVNLDFTARDGAGLYCLNGLRYSSFIAMPGATFTRATPKTALDSAGVLHTFAAGVPAITDLGILIEESRTNSIRNSTATNGAVVGTLGSGGSLPTNWISQYNPSSLTIQVVGTGTESGLPYVDVRMVGVLGAASQYNLGFETASQIVASTGQVWATSFYARMVAGSAVNFTRIAAFLSENTSTGSFVAGDYGSDLRVSLGAPLIGLNRSIVSATLNGGATVARFQPQLIFEGTGAVDITLRLAAPQAELGAFPTSYIPTTSAAAMRAADNFSLTGLAAPLNWTMAGEADLSNISTQNQFLAYWGDGTTSQRAIFYRSGTEGRNYAQVALVGGNVLNARSIGGDKIGARRVKEAMSFDGSIYLAATDGAAFSIGTSVSAAALTINRINLGRDVDATQYLNGNLRELVMFTVGDTASQLNELTQ